MFQKKPIPVYIFTGFLDAGKTKFINDTLASEQFAGEKSTLLIVCEEGEEEYSPSEFADGDIRLVNIENESQLNPKYLSALTDKYPTDQIMIEYNGMWLLDSLYRSLPTNWGVVQEFAFFDSNTILSYNANMRNLVADKLQSCDLAVFNRVGENEDIMPFHKLVRAVSRGADIVYDRINGKVERDEIEDPLPFDKNAEIIEIADTDYALWYRDMGENLEQYEKKSVCFKGMVSKNTKLKTNEMVVGRKIMTCCIDDTSFAGLVCEYGGAPFIENEAWITITADIVIKKHPLYETVGPVLIARTVTRSQPPEIETVTFA